MDAINRWSRAKEPLRVVGEAPGEAATSIVSTASAILREELQSFVTGGTSRLLPGVTALRGQPGEPLRGEVQSLVDALSSLVGVPSDRLSELISQLPAGIPSEDLGASKSVGVLVGVLKALQPVTPGQVSRIPLHLANDNAEADECSLWSTDLIGPSGRRIPAAHVRVIPQPIRVPGGGSTDIQIEVRVPSETAAGDYTGLLQSDDGNAVRALVHISVRR